MANQLPAQIVLGRTKPLSAKLRACVSIARIDHWTKNVFVLPGVIIPLTLTQTPVDPALLATVLTGMLSVGLIASSNYTINEFLDAPFDRLHPVKQFRPVAQGLVSAPVAYVQWFALMIAGMALAATISRGFFYTMAALWIMGCIYNLPPVRTKDLPYVDVLSESVNNPLRMVAGWYMVSTIVPPFSLLTSYWMVGCYFMGLKRFSELRELGQELAASYRRSFRYYTDRLLLVSVMFYAAAAMLFFGAFIIRYRVELVLSFPLVAMVMAIYFHMSFDRDSPVQHPEHLYKHRTFLAAVVVCAVVMCGLVLVDIPWLSETFAPTLPVGR